MTSTHIRIKDDDFQAIKEYRESKQLDTNAQALCHAIRIMTLYERYINATDEDKKTGRWYKPPTKHYERTSLDEMNEEDRNRFMRGFAHGKQQREDRF